MENKLKEIIDETGVKVTFISEKSGVSRQTIYDIINKRTIPNLFIARRICMALNKNMEEVFIFD